jgi:hypothetical protein
MQQPSNRKDCIQYCQRTLCAHTDQSPCGRPDSCEKMCAAADN